MFINLGVSKHDNLMFLAVLINLLLNDVLEANEDLVGDLGYLERVVAPLLLIITLPVRHKVSSFSFWIEMVRLVTYEAPGNFLSFIEILAAGGTNVPTTDLLGRALFVDKLGARPHPAFK